MSEIEKMYKNAGIKPEWQECCKIADKYWANNTESGFEYLMQKECPYNQECTDECEYAYDKVVYPPFTAEKQIELIKWLSKSKNGFGFFDAGEKVSCCCDFDCEWFEENFYAEDFDNALSGLINSLWQDLTEEEKQQVKGILE